MRLRMARDLVKRSLIAADERSRGLAPARLYRMTAARAAELTLADVSRLPVLANDEDLQDGAGNFYFLADYSEIGGPDVLA